jgi:hypothetical protein
METQTCKGKLLNKRIDEATDEYICFFDASEKADREFAEKAISMLKKYDADIAAEVHTEWLPPKRMTFSYKSCPGRIMTVADPGLRRMVFRTGFLRDKGLRFDESLPACELAFAALSLLKAEKIVPVSSIEEEPSYADDLGPNELFEAVESAVTQAEELPYYNEIEMSVKRFAIKNLLRGMRCAEAGYYGRVHELFSSEGYSQICFRDFDDDLEYLKFDAIRGCSYADYAAAASAKLAVSFTSYPARIAYAADIVSQMHAQTLKPDAVFLTLCKEEFPEGEGSLPEDLRRRISDGMVNLIWCDVNIKAHKKYLYAFRELDGYAVVTVDDDIKFRSDILERLWYSYLRYPEAVSAIRTHYMTVGTDGKVMPYENWVKDTGMVIHSPSHRLLATGGAGALYPPSVLRKNEMLQESLMMELAPLADDLYLKAMELTEDVPVVRASAAGGLRYLGDTQEDKLWDINIEENDRQLKQLLGYISEHYPEISRYEEAAFLSDEARIAESSDLSEYIANVRRCDNLRTRELRGQLNKVRRESLEKDALIKQLQKENERLRKEADSGWLKKIMRKTK